MTEKIEAGDDHTGVSVPPLPVVGQFLRFAAVGAVGTIFHYIVLVTMVQLMELRPLLGSGAGFAVGAFVNYRLNYRFTFRSTQRHGVAMPRFYLVALAGLGFNTLLMYVLNERLNLHYLIAQVLATGAVFFSNFVGNRLWTFKETVRVTDRSTGI